MIYNYLQTSNSVESESDRALSFLVAGAIATF